MIAVMFSQSHDSPLPRNDIRAVYKWAVSPSNEKMSRLKFKLVEIN